MGALLLAGLTALPSAALPSAADHPVLFRREAQQEAPGLDGAAFFASLGEAARGSSQRRGAHELEAALTATKPTQAATALANASSALTCGSFQYAPTGACPSRCPFYAEHAKDVCSFQCVPREMCGSQIPEQVIADVEEGICRKCKIIGCAACAAGHEEVCSQCSWGYGLRNGKCDFLIGWYSTVVLGSIVVVAVLFWGAWYIELCLRPTTNGLNLAHADHWRSQTRLRQPVNPEAAGEGRQLWPLQTNLCRDTIAGPGTTLHFSFQFVLILWAAVLALGFCMTALVSDTWLMVLGTREVRTEVEMCSIVASGRAHMGHAMPGKVAFCLFAYVFTFVGCILYSFWSNIRFGSLDDDETQKDFAAFCSNLPILGGTEDAESLIKQFIESKSGQPVVGVSICWQYSKRAEEVDLVVEHDLEQLEKSRPAWKKLMADPAVSGGPRYIRGLFGRADKLLLRINGDLATENSMTDTEIVQMLQCFQTSGCAFAVFETEQGRDAAVKFFAQSSTCYEGCGQPVRLDVQKVEPSTVRWWHFTEGGHNHYKIAWNLCTGSVRLLAFIGVWTTVFYLPYAWYLYSQIVAANGNPQATGASADYYFFIALVTVGQQILFNISADVATGAGFLFEDAVMATYVAVYALASLMTVGIDVVVSGWLYYQAMKITNVHTADGRKMEELASFQEILESFPMQRQMGVMLWGYTFPGCYILGFVMEPVMMIFIMGSVLRHLVRTHPEIQGRRAELVMSDSLTMDLGRYADVGLNAILSSICLLFAPGFTTWHFGAVALSHAYIYAYDHLRVLRCSPAFCYASQSTNLVAQSLMSIPCAIMLCAFRYKVHFVYDSDIRTEGLFMQLAALFILQVAVQSILVSRVIPTVCAKRADHDTAGCTFQELAKLEPSTWFTRNPVHCLRSKYIHKHAPFCRYHCIGKEHLQAVNPEACAFFADAKADADGSAALEGIEAVEASAFEDAAESAAPPEVALEAEAPDADPAPEVAGEAAALDAGAAPEVAGEPAASDADGGTGTTTTVHVKAA